MGAILDNGLISTACASGVAEVADRLQTLIEASGLTVFARIDHGANAAANGLAPRPTLLPVFGNPRGGTPLMQLQQTAGIDLPFKTLIREDEKGGAWLTCKDAQWPAGRHGIDEPAAPVLDAIMQGMAKMSQAVSQPL